MASAAAAKSSASVFISLVTRRGYASASHPSVVVSSGGASTRLMLKKGSPDERAKTASWGPDPVTGYYRPDNHAKEIDAAELRRVLLSKK